MRRRSTAGSRVAALVRKLDIDDVAVFSRSHRVYLDEAATIGTQDPSVPVVFRARARWRTAEREIGRRGVLPIYLAAVGAEGQVEYAAELSEVLLDPVKGSPEVTRWLARDRRRAGRLARAQ